MRHEHGRSLKLKAPLASRGGNHIEQRTVLADGRLLPGQSGSVAHTNSQPYSFAVTNPQSDSFADRNPESHAATRQQRAVQRDQLQRW